ncbi:MAG TPA: hypothetical protein PKE40_07675 [Arachnia sp.]|nr:hypothetical protein [Arachnia sp.]HMT86214.1 hypothetical protein [Arachnia sp.]
MIAVARNRQGQWFTYAPEPEAREPRVFLSFTRIYRGGRLGEAKRWQTVPVRSRSLLQVAWSAEEWERWNFAAHRAHYLSKPERDAIIGEIVAAAPKPMLVTERFDRADPTTRYFTVWSWHGSEPREDYCMVMDWSRKNNLLETQSYECKGGALAGSRRTNGTFTHYTSHLGLFGNHGAPFDESSEWADANSRHKLAWFDEDRCRSFHSFLDSSKALAKVQRDIRDAKDRELYRLMNGPVKLALVEYRELKLRAAFVEEYGPGADDLWPNYLAARKPEPYRVDKIRTVLSQLLDDGDLPETLDLEPIIGIPVSVDLRTVR